jgi:DNA-binding response OmpR family regulator
VGEPLREEGQEEVSVRKRIMVMDDEEMVCKELQSFLNEQGYEVQYALDGKQGLDMIQKNVPNLLLLDIRMPRMDGLQVLAELTSKYPNLVVVVISGYLDAEITGKVIEHGGAACVDKPFKLEELYERVIKPLIGEPLC